MEYKFRPQSVCAMQIKFNIDDDVITNIEFQGGCNGNLKAISKLVDGWTVDQIEEKLIGNTCGMRGTSCADQLAKAVRKAYVETH
ncbi:MAG: TIGR03905 family TSCPD domain-containing protein [Eubacterium sp.]|nr:TIGR03905 family TSCPD domain-containing protein [Eubacterium sp.]